jgi:hypothetical protein
MVGYTTNAKAYLLWNSRTDNIFQRTSVIFDENRTFKDLNIPSDYAQTFKEMSIEHKDSHKIWIPARKMTVQKPKQTAFPESKTYAEAMASPYAQQWKESIKSEVKSLKELDVFEYVKIPWKLKKCELMDYKWVFKVKYHPDHSIERFKVCLVGNGYSQKKGVNYFETYSPVIISHPELCFMIIVSMFKDWELDHVNIKTAYLNGPIDCEVFMRLPKGFPLQPSMTICLNKELPGTQQGGQTWNLELKKCLEAEGYTALKSEQSIFYCEEQSTSINTIISIYIDDSLISGDRRRVDDVKAAM